MTIYDPIIFLRLHGWGVVSSEDTQVIDCASTNNSTGVASLYITSIATINADEIGSEVFISGVTGLVDGFYTLTNFTVGGPSPGLDTIEIKGDPDLFSLVPGGGIYIGSAIRIEDHYKICNRIPDFVTGTSALSRWYLNLIDITPTLSSQVNVRGGVSKIDGVTLAGFNDSSFFASAALPAYLRAKLKFKFAFVKVLLSCKENTLNKCLISLNNILLALSIKKLR